MSKGVDVSSNQGVIDWTRAKAAGVEFAVIRSTTKSGAPDKQFQNNVAGCKRNSIPFGAYKYTYATTNEAARTEAESVAALLSNAQVPRGTVVFWDVENSKLYRGFGSDKLTQVIQSAKTALEAAGYCFGLYVGLYVYREQWFDFSAFSDSPLWVARYPLSGQMDISYTPADKYKPAVSGRLWGWQYSSSGFVDGIPAAVDLDICYDDLSSLSGAGKQMAAESVLEAARAWVGCNEEDGTHKAIIDLYNAHKPLARGYAVKYTDAWCATFVSACAIVAGCTDIIPTECSCAKMVELFEALGEWEEDDGYVPSPGDIVFFDWNDGGKGDNRGNPGHVGIVESVSGGKFVCIEGNKSDAVGRREMEVNGKYIRGFGVPAYSDKAKTPDNAQENVPGAIWVASVADVATRAEAEAVAAHFAAVGITCVVHQCKVI